jgi:hypothetical protein
MNIIIKILIGGIIIWALVVGFAYDIKTRSENSKNKDRDRDEGFVSSINGIITDMSGNILTCPASKIGQMVNGGLCIDLSYVDQYGNMRTGKIVSIYPNYYIDPRSRVLQPVPYGFMPNDNQIGITAKTGIAAYQVNANGAAVTTDENIYKNFQGNLDSIVDYHNIYKEGDYAPDGGGLPIGQMWAKDANGKLTFVSIFDSSFNNSLYYEPGAYKYGAQNYVPTYENSVYLSNLANYSQIANITLAPVTSSSLGIGFCHSSKTLSEIDATCSSLDSNTCSSMECCNVLDGGKCVGGSRNGPFYANSVTGIINRDFYYYQGKCYGSCNK